MHKLYFQIILNGFIFAKTFSLYILIYKHKFHEIFHSHLYTRVTYVCVSQSKFHYTLNSFYGLISNETLLQDILDDDAIKAVKIH